MSWLVENWQLKGLALLLAVGLFGAVAFQQNPIQARTLTVPIRYDGFKSGNLMLLNPPTSQSITLVGTNDAFTSLPPSSVFISIAMAKIDARGQYQLNGQPVLPRNSGLTLTQSTLPFTLTVDEQVTTALPIQVRVQPAPGWTITKAATTPDKVQVTLPRSLVGSRADAPDALKAFVSLGDSPFGQDATTVPSLPVQFEKGGQPVTIKPTATLPQSAYNPSLVSADVTATRPNVTRQVTLLETPSGTVANGYRVTDVTVSPFLIKVSGPADRLANLDTIDLPAVGIDGATSNVGRRFQISQILPSGLTSDTQFVQVLVVVAANPAVQPSPSPRPTPSPSP